SRFVSDLFSNWKTSRRTPLSRLSLPDDSLADRFSPFPPAAAAATVNKIAIRMFWPPKVSQFYTSWPLVPLVQRPRRRPCLHVENGSCPGASRLLAPLPCTFGKKQLSKFVNTT